MPPPEPCDRADAHPSQHRRVFFRRDHDAAPDSAPRPRATATCPRQDNRTAADVPIDNDSESFMSDPSADAACPPPATTVPRAPPPSGADAGLTGGPRPPSTPPDDDQGEDEPHPHAASSTAPCPHLLDGAQVPPWTRPSSYWAQLPAFLHDYSDEGYTLRARGSRPKSRLMMTWRLVSTAFSRS